LIDVKEEEGDLGTGDLYIDFLKPKSKISKEPFSSPQNTSFEAVSSISRSSWAAGGMDSSPSGGISVRFPRLMERIGDWEANDEMTSPEETSQSFSVQSNDEDKILRPRAMMAESVTVRVWALIVRTGEMCVPMLERLSGRSAGRTVREKSWLEDSRTRDEGKNFNETTLLR
jgi:hypothetical protein